MKTIYNKQNIKFFIAGLVLVLVASLGIFVQSCSQEDPISNIENSSYTKFLDLDVTSTTAFTKTELDVIANAGKRITDHLVFDKENNKYSFALKSAAEINVSERLFNYIYSGISIDVTETFPRLKVDVESNGWLSYTYHLTDAETKELMQNVISAYASLGSCTSWASVAMVLKTTKYAGLVTAMTSLYASMYGGDWTKMYNNYINTSNGTGSYFTETTMTGGTVPYTTYQFSYTKIY